MKELIEALTRAANAVADYYQGLPRGVAPTEPVKNAVTEERASEETTAGAGKPKRGKKAAAEPAAAPNPNDDILGTSGGAEKPAAKKAEMTAEESVKAVTDTAKLLVSKYAKAVAPDNKPEGFHIAKALLIEDFKVGRLSDLSHEQRIDFVKQVKEILVDDKKAQAILNRKAAAV